MSTTFSKVVVACGGRDFTDWHRVQTEIDKHEIDLLIQGGANGADRLAARAALKRGIPMIEVPANWDRHGKRAGFVRNALMADLADSLCEHPRLLAFPGGRGTAMMVDIARRRGWRVLTV